MEDARVAITAVNPAPFLVKDADAHLVGMVPSEEIAERIGDLAAQYGEAADHLGADAGVSARDGAGVREASGDGGGELRAKRVGL